jgi:two-component system phosphate regulon sensor histidine kinase PhoR
MPDISLDELTNAYVEHDRLVSLINSMVDGVIAVDEAVKVVMYNGAALNILDINSSVTKKSLGTICHLIDSNNQPIDIVDLIKHTTRATINRDLRLQYHDGSTIHLYLSIAPVHTGYGKERKRGYVVLLRDISREKSLEEERDEFISVVSHELRTPIAIAEGNISNAELIVSKGGSMETIKDALKQAHDQTLFLASINVHDLLTDLSTSYTPPANKKGLEMKLDLSPNLELLQSCGLYVREILQNFVTNAIKYTETGHITIGARPADKGVNIWVEDTGIGISISDQEKIYDKFFRSEDFRTRKNNGTGLGLYVTMKLARLVHADISTKSELNKGSRFTIFFPDLK